MGPPADRDIIMGPPPVPAPQQMVQHAGQSLQQTQQHGEQDITDKYKKLKRRYFELEEVSVFVRVSSCTIRLSDVAAETQGGRYGARALGRTQCENERRTRVRDRPALLCVIALTSRK